MWKFYRKSGIHLRSYLSQFVPISCNPANRKLEFDSKTESFGGTASRDDRILWSDHKTLTTKLSGVTMRLVAAGTKPSRKLP